jgi:hypothetical protein
MRRSVDDVMAVYFNCAYATSLSNTADWIPTAQGAYAVLSLLAIPSPPIDNSFLHTSLGRWCHKKLEARSMSSFQTVKLGVSGKASYLPE